MGSAFRMTQRAKSVPATRRWWDVALIALLLASACFMLSDLSWSRQPIHPDVALPSPGLDVEVDGRSSVDGVHQLWVEIPSLIPNRVDMETAPPIPCAIALSAIAGAGTRLLVRSTLHHVADWPNGHIYATGDFRLPKGDYRLRIANGGCANGYVFQGGIAHVIHPQPVTIAGDFLLRMLAYLFALIGLCGLVPRLLRSIAASRSRRPEPPSSSISS
jgi:hypothetical protein